jgi:hypothetical protein
MLKNTTMQKIIPTKFLSQLLLVVMLTMMITGVQESVHAMQCHVKAVSEQAKLSEITTSHLSPSFPLEQHKDFDGCDTCANCTCHAPISNLPLQIRYNPLVLTLHTSEPFRFLPKVFLSKFIPPQIHG